MSKDIIYCPGTFTPLHLWHEDFIKKIQDITWKNLHISLKFWLKTIKKIEQINIDWKFNKKIKILVDKQKFLSLEEEYFILKNIYPKFKITNDTRNEIIQKNYDGIMLWSDNFNLMINTISRWKKINFHFKKIYVYERVWYPILSYIGVFKNNNMNIKVVKIWNSKYDISSSKIVNIYNKTGDLYSIQKFVSKEVFDLIFEIKT